MKYILIIVILAIFVGGGILAWQYLSAPKEEPKISEVKSPDEIPEEIVEDEIANWKMFTVKPYKDTWYIIKYPPDAITREGQDNGEYVLRVFSPNWYGTEGQRGYLLEFWQFVLSPEKSHSNFRETVLNLGGMEIISEKSVIIDNREGIYITAKVGKLIYDRIYLPFSESILYPELRPGREGILEIAIHYGEAEGEKEKYSRVVEKIYTSLKFKRE